jgi:hypothetical protein
LSTSSETKSVRSTFKTTFFSELSTIYLSRNIQRVSELYEQRFYVATLVPQIMFICTSFHEA